MSETVTDINRLAPFPDHTQLPEEDGTFVKNFQEHPQSILLTDSLGPVLEQRHPDGQYCIGQDSGIYWRETDPPEKGAEAPDWFYVPNVPPKLDGEVRRSYVFWRELRAPLIALEFASGNGAEERDRTPLGVSVEGKTVRPGKFWVYEQIIRIPYYGIYEIKSGQLEVYHLTDFSYQMIEPNERGHYPIEPMGVELGLWHGTYQNQNQLWLRWWDLEGNLLLIGSERAELEKQRTEQEKQRAEAAEQRTEQEKQRTEQEKQRAEAAERKAARLAERLRSLGIDPDAEGDI
ncbi:Uma2 family endonuclease [Laspinema palackyanum]|uniref:Uma2 family endonuclease n=1 Tax=Laspinema palackyanum TaxID=3231601 RepID=UPI00345DBF63|nr:Uma2 family endonuclease [Laspinema sp. D2c]